jgi:hypothetical protein
VLGASAAVEYVPRDAGAEGLARALAHVARAPRPPVDPEERARRLDRYTRASVGSRLASIYREISTPFD